MKPFEDLGHAVRATKPFRLKRHDDGNLPDPGQCVDCLIIINNRHASSRPSVSISDGASWHHLGWLDQAPQPSQAVVVQPVERDITPMIRAAVEQCLPTLVQQPAVRVVQGPGVAADTLAALQQADKLTANAVLEMTEHVNRILNENADLMARVEFLEKHAVATARIVEAA